MAVVLRIGIIFVTYLCFDFTNSCSLQCRHRKCTYKLTDDVTGLCTCQTDKISIKILDRLMITDLTKCHNERYIELP